MAAIQDDAIWKQIDTAAYLYLSKLFEPQDNTLTVIPEEAISNEANGAKKILAGLPEPLNLGEGWPIESTPECSIFTLHWKSYVSYCVTEEMHGSCGKYEDEQYTGRLLRIYSKSHFLDFTAKDTGAHFEPYRHYKIACLNHVIDIVSVSEPALESQARSTFD